MHFDLMTGNLTWHESADLARDIEAAGFSGMLFTETSQVPWMMIAAAATAAPRLQFSTGIAVAFPRSPMISAQIAWELARNTQGRFRLGLGSQVRAHITRRYASSFDRPAARMRDYVQAVKASLAAFRGDARLDHSGPFYSLNLLRPEWIPPQHKYGDIKIDISAVGPLMCQVAGEVADGVHVHPMHSMHYIETRLRPALAEGAARVDRDPDAIDLIVPTFAIPGDTPEERAPLVARTKTQLAFYGSTPNSAFQFDDLGYPGTTDKIRARLRAGDAVGAADLITDEMLDHFAVVATWDDLADVLIRRYEGVANRLVTYLARDSIRRDATMLDRWGEVARTIARQDVPG